jgi:hypothetical protein
MSETTYFYLIFSQIDLLKSEAIEELLRERTTYYWSKEQKDRDFWVIISPKFVNSIEISKKIKESQFYQKNLNKISVSKSKILKDSNKLFLEDNEFYGAIVSTNENYIKWLSLRIGYFEKLKINNKGEYFLDYGENIPSNLFDEGFKSNGIFGFIRTSDKNYINPLLNNKNYLHPDLLSEQYSTIVSEYYNSKLIN